MKTLFATVPFVICLVWLLGGGCISDPYWTEYQLECKIVVLDRAQLCEMAGHDVDGWANGNTIYVAAMKGERPKDWIVGHEIKHLIYGEYHSGKIGCEE